MALRRIMVQFQRGRWRIFQGVSPFSRAKILIISEMHEFLQPNFKINFVLPIFRLQGSGAESVDNFVIDPPPMGYFGQRPKAIRRQCFVCITTASSGACYSKACSTSSRPIKAKILRASRFIILALKSWGKMDAASMPLANVT